MASRNLSEEFVASGTLRPTNASVVFDLLLAKGRPFDRWAPVQPPRGRMGMCFANAWRLARYQGLQYVEGYAIPDEQMPLPMLHAWCVDADGQVLDPTWPDGGHYFGVVLALGAVESAMLRTRRFGLLCNLHSLRMAAGPLREMLMGAACELGAAEAIRRAETAPGMG